MQVLILEDEPRAARQLQSMLKKVNFDYDLLELIDSVEEAIDWFKSNNPPDLIFQDIQLADGLSFEIFEKIKITAPIIFTTAFDQYAIQAFKVNSIDYLLKPIKEEDLIVALEKFKQNNQTQTIDPSFLTQFLSNMQQKKRASILVKQGNAFVQLKISDLLYAYSDDGITLGVTDSKRYIIEESMDKLFQSLDPTAFFRINRGQLVNKKAILKLEPYFNHRVKLSVQNPKENEFIVSRLKTSEFKDWMNS